MTRLKELTDARRPYSDLEPIAVIDIGSNSIRLVIYEGLARSLTPIFNEKVMAGLGRSLARMLGARVDVWRGGGESSRGPT